MTRDVLLTARARKLATSGHGRDIRIAAGLSLSEVAEPLGVSTTTLWRWERGERLPRGERGIAWVRLMDRLDRAGAR